MDAPSQEQQAVAEVPSGPPTNLNRPFRADALSLKRWSSLHSYVLLTVLTCAILLPFSNRAFHIDDTLFLRAGQHVAHRPSDPYGFLMNWDQTAMPMSQITKNPPLTCYFIALAGTLSGWSERSLHLWFLPWSLIVVLGTYTLARRFTNLPLLAALIILASPAFLVSASSVMCDTMMLALWMLAAILWLEGLEPLKPHFLLAAGLLVGAAALTKYFGIALIPLLLVYSLCRQRRLRPALLFLLLPVVVLVVYQLWTRSLYGHGLLLDAAQFANQTRTVAQGRVTFFGKMLVAASFLGGCALPGLLFAPIVWSRRQVCWAALFSLGLTAAALLGWIAVRPGEGAQPLQTTQHWLPFAVQFSLFVVGGISILAAAVAALGKGKKTDAIFLGLWVLGTFLFTVSLNWTVNARSILPALPAVGILFAQRLSASLPRAQAPAETLRKAFLPLFASAAVALWINVADTQLANSARVAAHLIHESAQRKPRDICFEGHWGFQYYMESYGAKPVDAADFQCKSGDLIVVPENGSGLVPIDPRLLSGGGELQLPGATGATTSSWQLGAGFYSFYSGPLPFAFGVVPPERYALYILRFPS